MDKEKELSYFVNWEARDRQSDRLFRRIHGLMWMSVALLVLLMFAPIKHSNRLMIALPIMAVNTSLLVYGRYRSRKNMQYLEESYQRLVKEESDRAS